MLTKQIESVGYLFWIEKKHRNHPAMGPKGGGLRGNQLPMSSPSQRIKETVTIFHGTEDQVVRSIKRNGIVFTENAATDRDTWQDEERSGFIFATTDFDKACAYAYNAADVASFGSKPRVLEVKIPKEVFDKAKDDDMEANSKMFSETIKPEWIVAIHSPRTDSYGEDIWTRRDIKKSEGNKISYVPILIENK